jgi:hypothetical protein
MHIPGYNADTFWSEGLHAPETSGVGTGLATGTEGDDEKGAK